MNSDLEKTVIFLRQYAELLKKIGRPSDLDTIDAIEDLIKRIENSNYFV